MSRHVHPKAIGGKLLDRPMMLLLALFGFALAVIVYRFVVGMGAVSNMNDGYTWGIWEPVNVVVFTGIGAGAYSVGLLCYLLNRGQYHALVRPAVLLGAIAYTLGGGSIVVALGRYWNLYWLFLPGMWKLSSVMLEVAVCVTVYVCVLWIEVLPAVFDGAAASRSGRWSAWGKKWGGRLARAMPFIIALAMLLPTMHQSSLAGLLLIAGTKVHPLWHTALLPLLGLVSCLSMGCGAVVVLSGLMDHRWSSRHDQRMLVDLSKVNGGLLFLFAVLRLGDVVVQGKLKALAVPDYHLFFFLLEMALFLGPAVLFFSGRVQQHRGRLVGTALASVLAGSLWRVDAFIVCYHPGDAWHYRPALGEIAVTVGMAAVGVAIFLFVSRLFPVVAVERQARAALAVPEPAPGVGLGRAIVGALARSAKELAATVATPTMPAGSTALTGRPAEEDATGAPAEDASTEALAREIRARREEKS
jgi:Ni/Fe-hydrogenase subunit HybB-like protein